VARGAALAAAVVAALLAVSGAGGADAQTPKRGGTVVYLLGGEIAQCLNPLKASCFVPLLFDVVLEPALALTPDNAYRPQLASAEFTTKPPFTITYRIRPEARWSDGVPVTARDFVFTHEAIVAHVSRDDQDVHAHVRSVRQVGAKTVRVVLRSRIAGWRGLFSFRGAFGARVLPWHALRGQNFEEIWKDGIEDPRTGVPIGSGPFLLKSWERGRQMTLIQNPRYWGQRAYLDRIVIRFCRACRGLSADEALAALRQGDADVVVTADPARVSELRRFRGTRILALPFEGVDHLALNMGPAGHPKLRDKRVRRALAYGIDRARIARAIFGELDPSYPASNSAIFPNRSRWYQPNWAVYRHRPSVARRLLEEAGCRRGFDGFYECDGQRLSLRLWAPSGSPHRARAVELVQRDLRQVGVNVTLSFAAAPVVFGQIIPSGAFDAVLLLRFNVDQSGDAVYGCNGVANITGYCQRLVTRDLDQSERILDAKRRAFVLNRADVQLARDVPVIPLYAPSSVIAFRPAIRNIAASTPVHELWNAENWWRAERR
jgi:peptide/nickel transport system substrate-binding protein